MSVQLFYIGYTVREKGALKYHQECDFTLLAIQGICRETNLRN